MRLVDPIRTGLNGRPFLDYALLDFGTVSTNSRYVKANPFGNVPVLLAVELNYDGTWFKSGWALQGSLSGLGTSAGQSDNGNSIVVQTGASGVEHFSNRQGNALGNNSVHHNNAPCRVHVWRVGA